MQRVAGLLALSLILWLGVIAPVQAAVCEHDSSHNGAAHESSLCLWLCASHGETVHAGGAGHAVICDVATLATDGPASPIVGPDEQPRSARAPPSGG